MRRRRERRTREEPENASGKDHKVVVMPEHGDDGAGDRGEEEGCHVDAEAVGPFVVTRPGY